MNFSSYLEEVDRDNLMKYTKNISRNVRLSGSKEEKEIFEYVNDLLTSFGYKTLFYTRPSLISLPESATLEVDGTYYECITHSMGKSTDQTMESSIIYVGEGDEESLKTKLKGGEVLLVDGIAIPAIVKLAEKYKASGLIFINAEYTHEMIISTNWGNPDIYNKNDYPDLPVVSINYYDGEKIKKQLLKSSKARCQMTTNVRTEWRDIPTLIAEYKGNIEPEKFVLFSGHIDSWHYGAMDNGTANATMIEIARILSDLKPELKRSVRFAFWSGHSHGRYSGSTLYGDENWQDIHDNCVTHVNIDSVGAKNANVLTEGNTMQETKPVIKEAVKSITGEIFEGSRYGRSGDQSFWIHGVPSILMGLSEQEPSDTPAMKAFSKLFGDGKGGGFGWWWHTTEDTLDKISPSYLERDCKIYLSIILNLGMSEYLQTKPSNAIEEIEIHVEKYLRLRPSHPGLNKALNLVQELKPLINEFEESKITKTIKSKTYNSMSQRISRALIRVNYVEEDSFRNDKAVGKAPLPLLSYALDYESASSDEKFILDTTLLRNSNKFNYTLNNLIRDLNEYLKGEK
ncbi:M28 family peptidase [Salinicoccus roseus]|uniref:M28 family metallopeptidase n=1 Tax=Salinicoccus roseus TaxID=45670 RepID=UPI001CA5FAB2|nr:M28 family metallopeptidase [Salinicoccus roseus]MBY8908251.1 M28 family peptidase [Salinicoccus roseus]